MGRVAHAHAPETQGTLATGPTGRVHRGPEPIPRSNRTPQQVERNRVFMAAAGRVEFGRYEATLSAVWIAFAYFASLGVERICNATVEHIAERAKVSGRTVQRHIPALIERGRIYSETRAGGRATAVWKVILPDELIAPVLTPCRPRGDRMSDEIRDRTYVPGREAKPQARPGEKIVNCGSGAVTTAAPLKGSPAPLTLLATEEEARGHVEAMRTIAAQASTTAQRPSAGTLKAATAPPDDGDGTMKPPTHSDEQEALFKEQDRLLQQQREARGRTSRRAPGGPGCPKCGHDRLMGGSCDQCGYDDGTGFTPNPDYNAGH